jgi:uncharacterized protein (TIGR00725 family)
MSYLFQPDPSPSSKKKEFHLRFTVCVSGAAAGETVEDSADLAEQLGAEIAKHGHILTTGATVGLPFYAAKGATKAGGMSIGFSPAGSLREHLRKYRLPFEFFDFINFTGMQYVGRDLYLVQSSDAVITVGGRFGSLHEFISALEAGKPCGILLGSGGAADLIPKLMDTLEAPHKSLVVYDADPSKLVEKIEAILEKEYKDIHDQFLKKDQFWFVENKKQQG